MIVALFVLMGFGWSMSGQCCHEDAQSMSVQVQVAGTEHSPAADDGCQCVCHQVFSQPFTEPVKAAGLAMLSGQSLVLVDEVPPDAVPLGIEYPPQVG